MIYQAEKKIKKLRSYTQFPFKIADSARGVGKSYSFQDILIDVIQANEFFTLIRESQVEINEMLSNGFWDLQLLENRHLEKWKIETRGNFLIVNDRIVGTAVALTTYANYRQSGSVLGKKIREDEKENLEESENFIINNRARMKTCFFDEFEPLIPKLSDEQRGNAFLHVLENLFRMNRKGVSIYMAGNIEKANSALLNLLNFPEEKEPIFDFVKSYSLLRHKPLAVKIKLKPTEEWAKARQDSVVGLCIEGKDGDIFNTGAACINTSYKKIMPRKRHILFNLNNDKMPLTIWKTIDNKIQITPRTTNQIFNTYVFKNKEVTATAALIPKLYKEFLIKNFKENNIEFASAAIFENFKNNIPMR